MNFGANDGDRTRYIQDHNLALYRLSYVRRGGIVYMRPGRRASAGFWPVETLPSGMRFLVACAVVLAGSLAHGDSRAITGIIVERPNPPGCGIFEIWTVIRLDVSKDPGAPRGAGIDPKRLPVALHCIELVKPAIAKGDTITVTLDGPKSSGPWGKQRAWVGLKPSRVARP